MPCIRTPCGQSTGVKLSAPIRLPELATVQHSRLPCTACSPPASISLPVFTAIRSPPQSPTNCVENWGIHDRIPIPRSSQSARCHSRHSDDEFGGGSPGSRSSPRKHRLLSVTGSPLAATFVYDWSGQRFSKANPGTSPTIYSYAEGGTLIAENDGGTVTDYIYADGRPIATIQPTASPAANQVNYILADHLGTPQLASNSGGATVWSTTYPPFGTTGVINAVTNQNLRFPGQYNDTETGFNYNLNRDYMPNLGRYIEADPIGLQGGVNVYSYARANPARFIDRFGLQLAEPDLSQDDIFSDDYNEDLKRSLEDMGQYVVDLEDTAQKIGDAAATPTVCSIATASNASTDSEIAPFPPLWLPTAQQASFQKSLLKMLAPQIRRRRYDPGEIQ